MELEKIAAIIIALLEDQWGVKIGYEIHRGAESKPESGRQNA